MEKYLLNFQKMTLSVSKEFSKKSQDPESEEFQLIVEMTSKFPKMKVIPITHRSSSNRKSNPDKGFSYTRMERYIMLHENAEELMKTFSAVKVAGKSQKNAYLYVKSWFMKQFPKFKDIPCFENGKLKVKLLTAEDFAAAQTEEKQEVDS